MRRIKNYFNKDILGIEPEFRNLIERELVEFLYKNFLESILAELFPIAFLAICFWPLTPLHIMAVWLGYCLLVSATFRLSLLYSFKSYKNYLSIKVWKNLYIFSAMLAGASWGLASIIWLPKSDLLHQSFLIILIVGVCCGANSINSAIRSAFSGFLFVAFTPLVIWLFYQGDMYKYIGGGSLVYYFVMMSTCFKTYQLLVESLILRFKNTDLGSQNQLLGEEVHKRTSDLKSSLALIESTLESTEDRLIVLDLNMEIQYYNTQILSMFHIPKSAIKTLFLPEKIHLILDQLINPDLFINNHYLNFEGAKQEVHDEIEFIDGRVFECYSKPHKLDKKIIGRILGFRDITKRKRLEQQISYQATHDSLTMLPNRALLYDRLEHSINICKRTQTQLVVMFIDIDNFKDINDSLGHHCGDKLIQCISLRLLKSIRKSDTAARLGGDEFVILFTTDYKENITQFCQKILEVISLPIKLNRDVISTTVSIGVSIYPQNGNNGTTLLKNADLALYLAKKKGRGQFQLYNDDLSHEVKRRQDIQRYLLTALNHNEFSMVYQPVCDLKTKKFVSVEALIRWDNSVLGSVSPAEFIPIAEESNLIINISEWVIHRVCEQYSEWQRMGVSPFKVAINISGIQLKRGNLIELIDNALTQSKLSYDFLELELTETSLMDASNKTLNILNKLKDKGIQISIDDFGSGYSSFSYLKDFPANRLKIDKSFIQEASNQSIINAIVTMGHELNLKVLAEGVETEEQLLVVVKCNCDEMQGFLYSKPLNVNDLLVFLESHGLLH